MTDETPNSGGISRRDVLRRGAIVGGVVWSVPIVQSLASPAFAAGSEAPGGGDGSAGNISYVVLFVTCNGVNYAVKYQKAAAPTGYTEVCYAGSKLTSNDDAVCTTLWDQYASENNPLTQGCPPGVTGYSINGNLQVNLGDCTLQDFIVHDGQLSPKCYGNSVPAGWTAPTPPTTGTVTFTKP